MTSSGRHNFRFRSGKFSQKHRNQQTITFTKTEKITIYYRGHELKFKRCIAGAPYGIRPVIPVRPRSYLDFAK